MPPSRTILSTTDRSPAYEYHEESDPHPSVTICAKFVTTTRTGRKDVLLLSVNKPLSIGRSPGCTYVVPDAVVSGLHCKLYAVRSSHGGIIISCQDHSTNGLILNGHRVRKTSILLMDGDLLEIPSSQKFECIVLHKEPEKKVNVFDPTPPALPTLKTKKIDRYLVMSHCLGSGSFAEVHLAMDTSAFKQVACKCIKRKSSDKIEKIRKEVDILLNLSHPNINTVRAATNDDNFLYIFLELCTGGDLFSYIVSHPDSQLCQAEAKYIMYQLLKGLKYLHDRLISHRDLKPENILLYAPGPYPRIQIADFGLARPKAYQETFNVCGTVSYLPPEGILALDHKHLSYVGMPSDCWSSGIIIGCHPFDYGKVDGESEMYSYMPESEGEDYDDSQCSQTSIQADQLVKRRIVHGEVEFPSPVWDKMPRARDLCSDLLVYDPMDRATAQTALRHEWLTAELLDLELAYRSRIGSV
ncbi:kinase-like protein [Dichomitus squalens LYAD-421 SS1]|uniref:Kinase-like protein n=1 Tax=Dichomitus squalens TaxID=114155 RepID=A0A4Q9Q9J8_9APHY|nr:kinase-like protein [Dichomitus squalens LYAD-421 SS1]EJF66900.1 kinase-like protein [Dichomitus squalens LYAD-421 SS1]TBU63721.1 kinase-like protein [Dichomitus squalens]